MRAYVKNNLTFYTQNKEYRECLEIFKHKFKLDDKDNPFVFNEFLDDFNSRKVALIKLYLYLVLVILYYLR
jgi:hypothetical protein